MTMDPRTSDHVRNTLARVHGLANKARFDPDPRWDPITPRPPTKQGANPHGLNPPTPPHAR